MKLPFIFTALAVTTCSADVTWIGGENGSWNEASNWDGGKVPEKCVVVFTNSASVTWSSQSNGERMIRGFVVSGGDVVVEQSDDAKTLWLENRKFQAEVAEGSTLTLDVELVPYYTDVSFTKKGAGTLVSSKPFCQMTTAKPLFVHVAEGTFRKTAGGFNTLTNSIAAGASMVFGGELSYSSMLVDVAAGGEVVLAEDADVGIGDLAGSGTVLAEGAATLTVWRNCNPETEFCGVLSGEITLELPAAATNGEKPGFLVTSADMLAGISRVIRPGALAFAPGIHDFNIAMLDGLEGVAVSTVSLEDTNGDPVAVRAGLKNASTLGFTGSGDLFVINAVTTLSGNNYSATGTVGTGQGGSLTLGSSFDLSASGASVREVRCEGGAITLTPSRDIGVPVTGQADKCVLSSASMKFSSFCLDASVIDLYGDHTYDLADGEAVIPFMYRQPADGAVFRVSGGMFSAGPVADGYDDVTELFRHGGITSKVYRSTSDYGTFEITGGECYLQGGSGIRDVRLKGGRLHFTDPFSQNNYVGDASILFDGGEAVLEVRSSSFALGNSHSYYKRRVDAGGAAFSLGRRAHAKTPTVTFNNPFSTADGVEADGGVSLRGNATFVFARALDINGPVSVRDGGVVLSESQVTESPDVFGTGDFRLGTARLGLSDRFGASFSKPVSLASGEGSAFVYEGAASVYFRDTATKAFQNVTVGALRRGGKGSVLTLAEHYSAIDKIGVEGGDGFVVSGRASSPFVREAVVIAGSGCSDPYFTRYDATYGFRRIEDSECKTLGEAGEDDPVIVSGSNATLGEGKSKSIAGAKICNWQLLTVGNGSVLTIGDGTNPAMLLFTYGGGVRGSGKVDFRGSEGIFYAGCASDTTTYHDISCRLDGSGGVSYVATPDYLKARKFILSGSNVYTGGTYVRACSVHARNSACFSSGEVYVGPGESCGGRVIFDRPLSFANAFHVGGWGMYRTGAFLFSADAVVEGTVELTAETRIRAESGVTGTISGTVSGDRLVVYGAAAGTTGVIALTGANVHTGGTEIVRSVLAVDGPEGLGTGDVTLDGGILELRACDAVTIPNRILGAGTVRLAGGGEVDLGNLDSQDGEGFSLDLACKFPKIASLEGISSISSSRLGKVYLLVTGDAPDSWNGTVTGNVSIQYGDEARLDGFRMLVK